MTASETARSRRLDSISAALILAIFITLVAYFGLFKDLSAHSIDYGMHYVLTEYIYSQWWTPVANHPYLGEMSVYPAMSHALAAISAHSLSASPLIALIIIANISVFFCYLAIISMLRTGIRASYIFSTVIFIALCAALHQGNLSIGGEVTGNFFYSQVVGTAIILCTSAYIFGSRRPIFLFVLVISAIVFGLNWLHPSASLQLSCAALAYIALICIRSLIGHDRKSALKYLAWLVATTVLLAAIIRFHPIYAAIKNISAHEGGIDMYATKDGAVALMVLLAVPVVVISVAWIYGRFPASQFDALVSVGIGALGATAIQFAAFRLGVGSMYGVAKNIFLVSTISAACTAALAGDVLGRFALRAGQLVHWPKSIAVVATIALLVIVVPSKGRSIEPAERTRAFIIASAPADAYGKTVVLKDELPLAVDYGLTAGLLHSSKQPSLVRLYGESILPPGTDPAPILAEQPLNYVVRDLTTAEGNCIVARSTEARSEIVRASCVGENVPYELGDEIVTGKLRSPRPYLNRGWSITEPWGVWSDADAASIVLRIKEPVPSKLIFEVEGHGFTPPGTPQQRVDVWFNGTKLDQWVFRNGDPEKRRSVAFTAEPSDIATIVLRFPDAVTPPGDGRKLGLGLESFKLSAQDQ